MLAAVCAVLLVPAMDLSHFVADRSRFEWRWSRPNREIALTSQAWHGVVWQHSVTVDSVSAPLAPNTAVLLVTGDRVDASDGPYGKKLARACDLPVFTLFNIPNQPLWEMREDDLIAHTFQKFIESGDETWPLLLPMVRSTVRAMDAIEAATAKSKNPIRWFIVTGASKRGWTTWLVGCLGDKRVVGLAPMVYDNLNVVAQMKHQQDLWKGFSERIDDYSRRNLQAALETPMGRKLAAIVDPYAYRDRITAPLMAIVGSKDPYWTADAQTLYWNELKNDRRLVVVPNRGHDLEGAEFAALGAFARRVAGKLALPSISWSLGEPSDPVQGKAAYPVRLSLAGDKPYELVAWRAGSKENRFDEAKYKPIERRYHGEPFLLELPLGEASAVFIEAKYRAPFGSYTLTTQVKILRPR